jgi:ribosome-associated protein
LDSKELLDRVLAIVSTHKAEEVVAFDVRGVVSYADYVVVCSGQNERQVEAIADHVLEDVRALGVRPIGIEGKQAGEWVLIDFGDVVVHVFDEPVRAFYDLDGMWGDVPRIHVSAGAARVSMLAH